MPTYELVHDESIMQGDIIFDMPVPFITEVPKFPIVKGQKLPTEILSYNAILISQSCDLELSKIDSVLVAELIDWPLQEMQQKIGKNNKDWIKTRKEIAQGKRPGYSLLPPHESNPKLPWTVVQYKNIRTVNLSYLKSYIKSTGCTRLRVSSPLREYLSQSVGFFFMRVGLPDSIDFSDFENASWNSFK